MAEEEDRPIIVGGGPQMINVELPRSHTNGQPGKFSVVPVDPKIPFKKIVIWDGPKLVSSWPLSQDWRIEID